MVKKYLLTLQCPKGQEIINTFNKNLQKMSEEEFKKEVQDLVAMLNNLRLIKDKGRRRWLKAEIIIQP